MSVIPHACTGQEWTEAIAVLTVAVAELRLENAKDGRAHAPGNQYAGTPEDQRDTLYQRWEERERRALRMEWLADRLREGSGATFRPEVPPLPR